MSDNVVIVTGTTLTLTFDASIINFEIKANSGKIELNLGTTLTVAGTFLNLGTGVNGVNGPGNILFTGTTNLNRLSSTGIRPNVLIGNGFSANTVTNSGSTVMADLTVNSNAIFKNNSKTVGISGNLLVNGKLISSSTKAFTFSGAGKTIGGTTPSITIYNWTITGSYTNNIDFFAVTNNLSGATGSLTNGANKTLTVGKNSGIATIDGNAIGNTVIYNRLGLGFGGQNCKATNYYNLTLSGSVSKNFSASPVIYGILSMEGIFTVAIIPTYGPNAKLQYKRELPQISGAEWIPVFEAKGGISIINSGIITINSDKALGISVSLSIVNDSGGGLDNGGFNISGGSVFALANDANLYLSGNSTFPSSFALNTLALESTVDYRGMEQTVAVQNYGNLSLSNSGKKTFVGATSILGELALKGNVKAILSNGSTSNSHTLTFNSILQTSTSWRGTLANNATIQRADWFGETTTGILNVNLACTIGTWLGQSNEDWQNTNKWCLGQIPLASTNVIIDQTPNIPKVGSEGAVCRNITISLGSSLIRNGTLKVSGNWINNVTLSSTGTIDLNGNGLQSIGGIGVNEFNNLTISNRDASVKATSTIAVKGVLNNEYATSVLDMSNYILSGTFSNIGLGQIKTANISSTPIPSGKNWTNLIVYNALTGGQKVVPGVYESLSLENASGVQTAFGNILINDKLYIANGNTIFKMNGFNLNVSTFNITAPEAVIDMGVGTLVYTTISSMDGIIRFSGTSNGKAVPSGTVEYNGSGKTVAGGTYNDLIFSGNGGYSVYTNVIVNNELSIKKGTVTVNSGVVVTVDNNITVNNLNGSFIFENNASLVQVDDDAVNEGDISYKRNTAPVKRYDFTYWSSPVLEQTLKLSSPDTLSDKYYSYNPNSNKYEIYYRGNFTMVKGDGYLVRAPQSYDIDVAKVDTAPTFIGVPNNGVINKILTGNTLYLLGNPYPSALDANTFLDVNSKKLQGTLYFWTHNSKPNKAVAGDAIYNYTSNDYAAYNRSGGVATYASSAGGVAPSGKIASGQGFFAYASFAGGNLVFDNSMRFGVGGIPGNNSQFYRFNANISRETKADNNRVWLNLSNDQGAFKQTLVGYITDATNDYDNAFDGGTFNGNEFIDFYSINNDKNLVIQGRAIPFDKTDIVPLGNKSKFGGVYNISTDQKDGLFETQNIYLEDKMLDVVHNLNQSSYSFTTQIGTFDKRFALRYKDKTLGNTTFDSEDSQLVISKNKRILKIKSEVETIISVTVFDLQGRKVYQNSDLHTTTFTSSSISLVNQIAIVKVTLQSGKVISKKINY